jgi:lysophospholipase L1-like esterase
MREKVIRWTMVVSAISCLVWVGGLAWALQDYFLGVAAPPPIEKKAPSNTAASTNSSTSAASSVNTSAATAAAQVETPASIPAVKDGSYRVVALGDSLTRGTGDPGGKGYVGYIFDHLKDKLGQEVAVENAGLNGQTAAQLAASLGQSQLQAQVKGADVITVSIGGNDLFRGGQTLSDLDPVKIKAIEDPYMRQLDAILQQLREQNATARIFLVGLYNPFIDLKDTVATTKIVRDWNYRAAEVAAKYPQIVLVPTADLFQLKVQDYLARDLFHPNAAGYRLIGERIASLITW